MPPARIHVTKLSAAKRQLCAAIRLYFAEEDELAVHTIASAAYRLLADLKAERGMKEAADVHLVSIFYMVRDYRRGILPKDATSNPELMAWVREVAEQLPIDKDSKIDEFTLTLTPTAVRDFWNKRNRIANFLKHADKDAGSTICLDEVDNLLLIMQCYKAYEDVARDDLGNEGFVFRLFMESNETYRAETSLRLDEFTEKLAELSEVDRLRFCSELISELNES